MSYEQGFIEKCAQYGVNPEALLKQAGLMSTLGDLLSAKQLRQGFSKSRELSKNFMKNNVGNFDNADDYLRSALDFAKTDPAAIAARGDFWKGLGKTGLTYGGLGAGAYGLSQLPGVQNLNKGMQSVYSDALHPDPNAPIGDRLMNAFTIADPTLAMIRASQRAQAMGKEAQGLKPATGEEKKKMEDNVKNNGGKDPDSKTRSKEQQTTDMKEQAKKNAKNPTIGSAGIKGSPYNQEYVRQGSEQLFNKIKTVLGSLLSSARNSNGEQMTLLRGQRNPWQGNI